MWGDIGSSYKRQIVPVPYGTLGLAFNFKTKLGKNLKFRKAIASAIKQKNLCSGYDYLIPNVQVLPNNYWGRAHLKEEYEPKESQKILSTLRDIPNPFLIQVFGQTERELKKKLFCSVKKSAGCHRFARQICSRPRNSKGRQSHIYSRYCSALSRSWFGFSFFYT